MYSPEKWIYLQTNPNMLRPHKSITHKHMHNKTIPMASHRSYSPRKNNLPKHPTHICVHKNYIWQLPQKSIEMENLLLNGIPNDILKALSWYVIPMLPTMLPPKSHPPKSETQHHHSTTHKKTTHHSYKLQPITLPRIIYKIFTDTCTTLLTTFKETQKILHCRQEGFRLMRNTNKHIK